MKHFTVTINTYNFQIVQIVSKLYLKNEIT